MKRGWFCFRVLRRFAFVPASSPGGPTRRDEDPTRRFRGWRRWLLRLSLLLIAPVLFFGVLEAGLRGFGYGCPTDFFLGPDAGGAYRSNDQFGWRFFPRPLARRPQPCRLPVKAAGTVRIFILGGSAALGIPDPAFGFGRILEVMLGERYPGVRFEVVNVAMTAINSHVAREIAGECAAHGADLFVVYMGNNEVMGPYGPGTVFQQWVRRRVLIRASIRLKATRVGQLVGDVAEACRGSEDLLSTWRGMEMCLRNRVAADSPELALVYANFRQNLFDICGIARRADAAVVLSTVAVNQTDFPPLASLHRSGLSSADLDRWDASYRAGAASESGGDAGKAIEHYEAAARIDDRYAELPFRLGRCLAAAGRPAEARERFALACDLDALRFRADRQINAVIREVAAGQETQRVYFADAARALQEDDADPGTVPSASLFRDHVHLTFDGNYRLAKALLEPVCAALPEDVRSRTTGAVPTRAQCAQSLALTPWDEFQMAAWAVRSMSRAPFTDQLDHAVRQAAASRRVERLGRLASTPEALQEAAQTYEAALATRPDDAHLHDHLAAVLHRQGKVREAAAHWRDAIRLLPNNIDTLHQLALVLATTPDASLRSGREAVELAHRAVTLSAGQEPLFLATLAAGYAASEQFAEAVETAEQALVLASRQNKTDLADALREQIAAYRVRAARQNAK